LLVKIVPVVEPVPPSKILKASYIPKTSDISLKVVVALSIFNSIYSLSK